MPFVSNEHCVTLPLAGLSFSPPSRTTHPLSRTSSAVPDLCHSPSMKFTAFRSPARKCNLETTTQKCRTLRLAQNVASQTDYPGGNYALNNSGYTTDSRPKIAALRRTHLWTTGQRLPISLGAVSTASANFRRDSSGRNHPHKTRELWQRLWTSINNKRLFHY